MQQIHELLERAPEKRHKSIQTQSHYLAMRDGTQIALDVLLPASRAYNDALLA